MNMTVRLNRKESGVQTGRGLLVAMEAVSKTAVFMTREVLCD